VVQLDVDEARQRFSRARVARLATADAAGEPHLVPVTFAVVNGVVVFAVDHKPKTTTRLRRLRNIVANPAVSFLVDHYDEDWARLWWVRADGQAELLDAAANDGLVDALCAKYRQYAERRPVGTIVRAEITTWRGWAATAGR
jgi:PPOX class probable F420-dependent enzyme